MSFLNLKRKEDVNCAFVFNADGYNCNGINSKGFNRYGFDEKGFDKNGFDEKGFDKDGFNEKGFDKNGWNKWGYDKNRLDAFGLKPEDYSVSSYYTKDGYAHDGYNVKGYNRAGYDSKGYNVKGFNKDGIDKNGYNESGYDSRGFNKNGRDKLGFDQWGKDLFGLNTQDYISKTGLTKDGYGHDGLDANGYNRAGYNLNGFNAKGFDKDGLDIKGFDAKGFDAKGFNAKGFDVKGFDKDGFDAKRFDAYGYGIFGTDINGMDRTGYDYEKFNASGVNKWGLKKTDYKKDSYGRFLDKFGYDTFGNDTNGYDRHGNYGFGPPMFLENITKKQYKRMHTMYLAPLSEEANYKGDQDEAYFFRIFYKWDIKKVGVDKKYTQAAFIYSPVETSFLTKISMYDYSKMRELYPFVPYIPNVNEDIYFTYNKYNPTITVDIAKSRDNEMMARVSRNDPTLSKEIIIAYTYNYKTGGLHQQYDLPEITYKTYPEMFKKYKVPFAVYTTEKYYNWQKITKLIAYDWAAEKLKFPEAYRNIVLSSIDLLAGGGSEGGPKLMNRSVGGGWSGLGSIDNVAGILVSDGLEELQQNHEENVWNEKHHPQGQGQGGDKASWMQQTPSTYISKSTASATAQNLSGDSSNAQTSFSGTSHSGKPTVVVKPKPSSYKYSRDRDFDLVFPETPPKFAERGQGSSTYQVATEFNKKWNGDEGIVHTKGVMRAMQHFLDKKLCFKYVVGKKYLDFKTGMHASNSLETDLALLQQTDDLNFSHIEVMSVDTMVRRRIDACDGQPWDRVWGTPEYMQLVLKHQSEGVFVGANTTSGLRVSEVLGLYGAQPDPAHMEAFFWLVCACSSGNIRITKHSDPMFTVMPNYGSGLASFEACLDYVERKYARQSMKLAFTCNASELEKRLWDSSYAMDTRKMDVFGYSDIVHFAELAQQALEVEQKELEATVRVRGLPTEQSITEDVIDKEITDKNYQMWLGTAPSCGATESDCQDLGFYKAVPESQITPADRKGYGASCANGKKVLCRWDRETAKKDLDARKLGFDGDPSKYEFKWFGTAPFCSMDINAVLTEGFIPVKKHSSGDGASCWTGTKILGARPRAKDHRYNTMLAGLEQKLYELSVEKGITEEKIIQFAMDAGKTVLAVVNKAL